MSVYIWSLAMWSAEYQLPIMLPVLLGWSGGAMVLGKLPVPGRPNLDDSRVRAYCACSRCGWGLFGHFYSPLSFFSSFSLSMGRRSDID